MNRNRKRIAIVAAAAVLLLIAGSCNDINKQSAPVNLVVTNTQKLSQIDLAGDAVGSTACSEGIGTVHILAQAIGAPSSLPNPNLTPADLNQVKIDRYRVSYVR